MSISHFHPWNLAKASLGLFVALGSSGCSFFYHRVYHKPAVYCTPACKSFMPHPECDTPPFYGHYPTCWERWPLRWGCCGHDDEFPLPMDGEMLGVKDASRPMSTTRARVAA